MSRAVVGLMAGVAPGFAAYVGDFSAVLLDLGLDAVGLVRVVHGG